MEGTAHVGLDVIWTLSVQAEDRMKSREIKVGCHWNVESIEVYLSSVVLS